MKTDHLLCTEEPTLHVQTVRAWQNSLCGSNHTLVSVPITRMVSCSRFAKHVLRGTITSSLGNWPDVASFDFYKFQTLRSDIYLLTPLARFLRQREASAHRCAQWLTAAGSFHRKFSDGKPVFPPSLAWRRGSSRSRAHTGEPTAVPGQRHGAPDPKPARNRVTQEACRGNTLS